MSEISAAKAKPYGNDDPVTGTRQTTDTNHSQVHAGNAYQSIIQMNATAPGSVFYIIMTVPVNVFAHFQSIIANVIKAGAEHLSIVVYEDVTFAAPLVANVTPKQRNRVYKGLNPASASALLIQSGVAVPSDLGVAATDPIRVSSNTANKGGTGVSSAGDGIERVTNQDTDYCVAVSVVDSTGTPLVDLILDWYEEVAGVA